MSAAGYIQVHAYSSYARIPIQDVAITVTATDGTAIAMRITDRSGLIAPVEVPVPDAAESLTPEANGRPFGIFNLDARHKGYEQIHVQRLQVFAGTVTDQDLEMIPLSELPDAWDQTESFDTPPQNL